LCFDIWHFFVYLVSKCSWLILAFHYWSCLLFRKWVLSDHSCFKIWHLLLFMCYLACEWCQPDQLCSTFIFCFCFCDLQLVSVACWPVIFALKFVLWILVGKFLSASHSCCLPKHLSCFLRSFSKWDSSIWLMFHIHLLSVFSRRWAVCQILIFCILIFAFCVPQRVSCMLITYILCLDQWPLVWHSMFLRV